MRHLYQLFFSTDCKLAQDKIRNKNSVFKQLHAVTAQELQQVREAVRQAVVVNEEEGARERQLRECERALVEEESEMRRVELERCQAKVIKMIVAMQGEGGDTRALQEQLSQFKVLELLKHLSVLIKNLHQ